MVLLAVTIALAPTAVAFVNAVPLTASEFAPKNVLEFPEELKLSPAK